MKTLEAISRPVIKSSKLFILASFLIFVALVLLPAPSLRNSGVKDDAGQENVSLPLYLETAHPQLLSSTLTVWQQNSFKHYSENLSSLYLSLTEDLNAARDSSYSSFSTVGIFLTKVIFRLLLNMGFIFLIATPFALMFLTIGLACGFYKKKNFYSTGLMGLLSTGRLFFSGIKVNSDVFDRHGIPDLLVPNLISLPQGSPHRLWESEITKLLQEQNLWNKTTQTLLGFILEKRETPAFIAETSEREYYNKRVAPFSIVDATTIGIEEALKLVDEVLDGKKANDLKADYVANQTANAESGKIDLNLYRELLRSSLRRILPKELKEELKIQETKKLLVLMVLALSVGKILTSQRAGGAWSSSSIFPELSARAAVHSVVSYPAEYTPQERTDLRRALVYCSRSSPINVTRQPLDMSLLSFALRQCGELLLTNPVKLPTIADEVEFHGLLYILHSRWAAAFYDKLKSFDKETITDSLSINSRALLIKIKSLVKILKAAADESTILRAGALINQIHQQNQLRKRSAEVTRDDDAQEYQKQLIFDPPLSFSEMRRFAEEHQLSLEDLKTWSILKNVLSYYGWLSRRVGDSPVSSQSISFYLVKTGNADKGQKTQPVDGSNSNPVSSLVKRTGMVALRGDRLFDKFGEMWSSRFTDIKEIFVFEKKEKMESWLASKANI